MGTERRGEGVPDGPAKRKREWEHTHTHTTTHSGLPVHQWVRDRNRQIFDHTVSHVHKYLCREGGLPRIGVSVQGDPESSDILH